MPSPTQITTAQLLRRIGLPDAPVIIDTRIDEDFEADPSLIPTAFRHAHSDIANLVSSLKGRQVVVVCHKGLKISQGSAAILRDHGIATETLEGGTVGWIEAGGPMVPIAQIPPRNSEGRTVWVEGVFWSHRGERCTFDAMIEEFQLSTETLERLARIVRGADTNRHDLAPEAAGLMAASLGLSRMYRDDLAQLEAGLALYDAFYRWSRDATKERHDWPMAGKS